MRLARSARKRDICGVVLTSTPTSSWLSPIIIVRARRVLPGGDGGAGFRSFVRRMHVNAFGDEYLVAQLVAPVWTPDQSKSVVWPLEKNRWQKMEFSTEDFVKSVVADVAGKHAIDAGHVFALGWSSGGPAVYAASVCDDSPLTGAFVAMSVFKPGQMASLKRAKGMAYFLLHSPQDFISMDFPETALKTLKKKRAEVELVTYEGGHGWKGDVYGNLRRGVRFLEKHHAKPRRR